MLNNQQPATSLPLADKAVSVPTWDNTIFVTFICRTRMMANDSTQSLDTVCGTVVASKSKHGDSCLGNQCQAEATQHNAPPNQMRKHLFPRRSSAPFYSCPCGSSFLCCYESWALEFYVLFGRGPSISETHIAPFADETGDITRPPSKHRF